MDVAELIDLPDAECPRTCIEVTGYLVVTGAFAYLAEQPDSVRGIQVFADLRAGLKPICEQLMVAQAEMYFGSTVLYHGEASVRGWLRLDGPPMFPLQLTRAFALWFQGREVVPGAFARPSDESAEAEPAAARDPSLRGSG